MNRDELFLKSPGSCSDFANCITLLLWEQFVERLSSACPDPHRFPELSKMLGKVLSRYIGQPGGETSACRKSFLLTRLLAEIEDQTLAFLLRGLPLQASDGAIVQDELRQILTGAISPVLSERLRCAHGAHAPALRDIPMYS